MGPLISAPALDGGFVPEDGAPVAFRGTSPDGPGYWFPPTVLCPVSNDDRVARALRVARAIDTGTLSINSNTSVRVNTPFGRFKQSGVGRELGPHALEYYTELKNVYMSTG